MKTPEQWFATHASTPGMMACGLRGPDGKKALHSLEESCPKVAMEKIVDQFDSLSETLFAGEFAPQWSTWSFGRGQIRFVLRADGWLLSLVVRAESPVQSRLDALSAEFLSLDSQ